MMILICDTFDIQNLYLYFVGTISLRVFLLLFGVDNISCFVLYYSWRLSPFLIAWVCGYSYSIFSQSLFLYLFHFWCHIYCNATNPLSDTVDDLLNYQYYTFIRQTVKYSESTERYYENCRKMIQDFHYWTGIYFLDMVNDYKQDFLIKVT